MAADGDDPIRLVATGTDEGVRLDRFITGRLPAVSRSHVHRLIVDGHVVLSDVAGGATLTGAHAKPALAVWDGLVVNVNIPRTESARPAPEALPLSILYEDDDLAV